MVFWLSFWLFIVFLVLESITSWIFIKRSERNHPDLWRHAGRPTLIGNGDLISAWPLNKYLMNRQYSKLKNQEAINFAESVRGPFVFSYFGACLAVRLLLIVMFTFGVPE